MRWGCKNFKSKNKSTLLFRTKRTNAWTVFINFNLCKIQVKFSIEATVGECSNASFSFNRKNLKEEYGIPQSSRYPFYVVESDAAEIFEGMNSDCKSDKKVKRKIVSSQDIFIEYQSYYARPFYVPESWSVEYRIWKAEDKYITVKN